MAQGRRLPPELIAIIEERAARGQSPVEIVHWLDTDPATAGRWDLPTLRTVQRYLRQIRRGDADEPWSLSVFDGPESTVVLEALRELINMSNGRISNISNRVARWLVSIHSVAPDLGPWTGYRMARMYRNREDQGLKAADLDQFLAFGPWRSDDAEASYEKAVAEGWIDRAPLATNWNTAMILAMASVAKRKPGPEVDPYLFDEVKATIKRVERT